MLCLSYAVGVKILINVRVVLLVGSYYFSLYRYLRTPPPYVEISLSTITTRTPRLKLMISFLFASIRMTHLRRYSSSRWLVGKLCSKEEDLSFYTLPIIPTSTSPLRKHAAHFSAIYIFVAETCNMLRIFLFSICMSI